MAPFYIILFMFYYSYWLLLYWTVLWLLWGKMSLFAGLIQVPRRPKILNCIVKKILFNSLYKAVGAKLKSISIQQSEVGTLTWLCLFKASQKLRNGSLHLVPHSPGSQTPKDPKLNWSDFVYTLYKAGIFTVAAKTKALALNSLILKIDHQKSCMERYEF